MTNDLMRDVIEGRIPMPTKPKPPTFEESMQRFADIAGEAVAYVISTFEKIAEVFSGEDSQSNYALVPAPPPADPRERSLRAKQVRGTGPVVEGRDRGRVTKYKEKS